MADRKQFIAIPEADPELKIAIENSKSVRVTEDQLREQRISFAFGNAPTSSTSITKETVRKTSGHIRLSDSCE